MTRIKELHESSPLRVLDRCIHGGLGRGELGVVCGGAGAGKTAFLVGVALDVLTCGGRVLHVALDQAVGRVRNYYDEIFAGLARSASLEDAGAARLQVERSLRIHAYHEHTFSVDALARALSFLRDHTDMEPDLIVVDGYDWDHGSERDIAALRTLAASARAMLWMACTTRRDGAVPHPRGYPEPIARYEAMADVLVRLKGADGTVHVALLKDHDDPAPAAVALDLDPTTLLLVTR